jgi:hypothetical protein
MRANLAAISGFRHPVPDHLAPSAFLPLPNTLHAEERTVRARRPVVTIIVCSA